MPRDDGMYNVSGLLVVRAARPFPAGRLQPGIRRQNAENEKIFFSDRVCTSHDDVRMRQKK